MGRFGRVMAIYVFKMAAEFTSGVDFCHKPVLDSIFYVPVKFHKRISTSG